MTTGTDKSQSPTLASERSLFAVQLEKINELGMHQNRDFLLTSRAFYHFHPDEFDEARRAVSLSAISGVAVSEASCEIVIQVRIFAHIDCRCR